MKIEKISDNQIRCTLTKEDLENHQIRLSELAYGTEKAKKLFRDMMQQANIQFGFEADNIPLMIEAIPVNTESIVLIITKVEDPEELDTRFSKFAPFKETEGDTLQFDGADNIIDIFQKLCDAKLKNAGKKTAPKKQNVTKPAEETTNTSSVNLIRLYKFHSLDDVIDAAHSLNSFFAGTNNLYKDDSSDSYQLVIHQSGQTPEEFNKVCNILSEYAAGKAFTAAGEAHLSEHGCLITSNAFSKLVQL